MNPGVRILPITNTKDLLGWRMSGQSSGQILVLMMGNFPRRQINHKLANGMKMWKGNGNSTPLVFFVKGLEILTKKEEDK